MTLMLIKSALVGALVAICGLVAWVIGSAVVGLQGIAVTGAGGLGVVSVGVSDAGVLLVSLACFALGSTWMYRRLRRRAAR